ncbi:MAG: FAD-dependent oxidoreductase [Chloroflexi bacterium]|nr:FAD-dependent oxidoreductase [Chloroflexota bacterium]
MKSFDLIVIGSGSGLEVSAAAAERGLNVAVVESGPFGGTCLNRGCIPSKMLVHVADVAQTIAESEKFGIHASVDRIDWPFIVERTFHEIDEDSANILEGNRSAENITVFQGEATFTGPKRLSVNDEEIGAETIVIAAGTRPTAPNVPGLDEVGYETTDTIMRIGELPRRLAILGGGFVAAELGYVFRSLGTEVTIISRGKTMLSNEDRDIAEAMTKAYRRRFDLLLESTLTAASRDGDLIRLEVGPAADRGGEARTVECDTLLVATGRIPNTDRLAVEATGVETDDRGYVRTDGRLETSVPGIWALGDIVGRWHLKHSANLEAAHVANNILNPEQPAEVDYHAMPWAIFGSPQIGGVGLTENEAEEQGIAYAVASYPYDRTAYGSSIEDRDGFVKVLADPASGEILGCHVIGHEASILVQEAVNVMRFRLPIDVLAQSIYIHPALPEVLQGAFATVARQISASRSGHEHEHQHEHEHESREA